jgi:hypothetical protein
VSGSLAIIPCGARKRQGTHVARELYVGPYFRAALRWAETGRFDRVLILSAKHGLVDLDDQVESYDLTFGDEGAVTADVVRQQSYLRLAKHCSPVQCVGGAAYRDMVRQVWPRATSPVDGCTSMGAHLRVLTNLAKGGMT